MTTKTKTKIFTAVRLRPSFRAKLEKIAQSQELSLSELMRKILEEYVEKL